MADPVGGKPDVAQVVQGLTGAETKKTDFAGHTWRELKKLPLSGKVGLIAFAVLCIACPILG
jgi:hypothetical protein